MYHMKILFSTMAQQGVGARQPEHGKDPLCYITCEFILQVVYKWQKIFPQVYRRVGERTEDQVLSISPDYGMGLIGCLTTIEAQILTSQKGYRVYGVAHGVPIRPFQSALLPHSTSLVPGSLCSWVWNETKDIVFGVHHIEGCPVSVTLHYSKICNRFKTKDLLDYRHIIEAHTCRSFTTLTISLMLEKNCKTQWDMKRW